jgi:hypothetical protein
MTPHQKAGLLFGSVALLYAGLAAGVAIRVDLDYLQMSRMLKHPSPEELKRRV